MVIDAKYKMKYQKTYERDDIRQLSGYSRIKRVVEELGLNFNQVVDCLIIYPDQETGKVDLKNVDLKKNTISEFVNFYKLGIKLPKIIPNKVSL
jgi:5-methylcytosine-specific restriction enzyme subunit McrC